MGSGPRYGVKRIHGRAKARLVREVLCQRTACAHRWVGQVLIGTLVPMALLVLPTRNDPSLVVLACGLIVIGIFGLRLNIVIPGLAAEEIHGLATAVSTPRLTATYLPTLSEWLLAIGIVIGSWDRPG